VENFSLNRGTLVETKSDPTLGESWESIQLSPSGFEFPSATRAGTSPGAYVELKCSGCPASSPGVYDSIPPAKSTLDDLFETLCSIDKTDGVKKDLLNMEGSPPHLDLDLFNWSGNDTSSPGAGVVKPPIARDIWDPRNLLEWRPKPQ
jgi:hypothetical protein